jgi:hypothetical protein
MLCAVLQLAPSERVPDWDHSWLVWWFWERVCPPEAAWSHRLSPLQPVLSVVLADWLVPWE